MSFSSEVKEELSKQIHKNRHCQLAELAGILGFLGRIGTVDGEESLSIYTENIALAKKYFTLIKKLFGISGVLDVKQGTSLHKNRTCIVSVVGREQFLPVVAGVGWVNQEGELHLNAPLVNEGLLQRSCCRRAFIRGAFLAAGSMSDPEKSYHFELVCSDEEKAEQLKRIINEFDLDAKIVLRKKAYVVYLKEGSQIVDMLNIMEAHVSLMNLENVRIIKEMRNSVNRQVNCETANINKTVNAAVKQVEDIRYIESTVGLDTLNESLVQMARIRLQYPEAALKELGAMLEPPVGKSGVNHRLRKISSIADELRSNDK